MAGYGNKTAPDTEFQSDDTKYGSGIGPSDSYSGATEHGSGTTAGAGIGNKSGSFAKDSTTGKIMEKVGGLVKNEGLVEKGTGKREAAKAE